MPDILEELAQLHAENAKMRKEIELLKMTIVRTEKKCACYINNLRMCDQETEE